MSDTDLLTATAAAILGDQAREGRGGDLWRRLSDSGLTLVGVEGGTLDDAAAVVRLCGYFAAPAPVAETVLVAAPALAAAGLDSIPGPLSVDVAPGGGSLRLDGGGTRVVGLLGSVPYAGEATAVVGLARDGGGAAFVVAIPSPAEAPEQREVLAAAPAPPGLDESWLQRRVALSRALLIAGAAERVVAMTVEYVQQRSQFGRPLAQFQVIQHMLAEAAAEAAAARAAAAAAVHAAMRGGAAEEWGVAAAKVRSGQAAARCATIAHQLHGAIGVTFEHSLHLFTTRLHAWRDEGGPESQWALRLGHLALEAGAPATWEAITASAG